MRTLALVLLGLLSLIRWTPHVAAQSALVGGPGGGSVVELETISGASPFAGAAVPAASVTQGFVDLSFGFQYLRPVWASRSLQLSVPSVTNPNLAIVDGTGDLPWSFTFIPNLEAKYDLASLGITAAASVEFIALTATLQRTINPGIGGSADLTASDNLTILIANFVEIGKVMAVADFCDWPKFSNDVVECSIGSRFTSIKQNYSAKLSSGTNVSNATASQDFLGLGLTAAVEWTHPLTPAWSAFSGVRGAVSLGTNNRKSSVSVAAPDNPALSFNNILIENQTDWLPVIDLESGFERVVPFGQPSVDGNQPVFFLRTAFSAQFWGTAGYLSASANNVSFGSRPLYLFGISVVGGVQY